MKRSTFLVITGVLILVLSIFSMGLSGSETIAPPPSERPVSSDDPLPPPEDTGEEGFGVRCC